jgi:hypothetical protein
MRAGQKSRKVPSFATRSASHGPGTAFERHGARRLKKQNSATPICIRGTAVTRLALSGCTVAQIAAIAGHSLRNVDEILILAIRPAWPNRRL